MQAHDVGALCEGRVRAEIARHAGRARKARGEEREFLPCRARLACPASLAASPVMNQIPATRREMVRVVQPVYRFRPRCKVKN